MTFSGAYKRIIDPGQHTHSVGVSMNRVYSEEAIQVTVGVEMWPNMTSHLTIAEAKEMVEALQEAIGLAEFAKRIERLTTAGKYGEADSVQAFKAEK